jgi:hypothetical protein
MLQKARLIRLFTDKWLRAFRPNIEAVGKILQDIELYYNKYRVLYSNRILQYKTQIVSVNIKVVLYELRNRTGQ